MNLVKGLGTGAIKTFGFIAGSAAMFGACQLGLRGVEQLSESDKSPDWVNNSAEKINKFSKTLGFRTKEAATDKNLIKGVVVLTLAALVLKHPSSFLKVTSKIGNLVRDYLWSPLSTFGENQYSKWKG